MLEKNKLTIGLPIFNEEKAIRKTLDSIMKNIDDVDYVIISDNASTDSTPIICQEFCEKCSKIKYYRNAENIGAWQNMVKLRKRIKTEYYMQLGGHDCLSDNSIKMLKNEMQEDTVCCFGKIKNQLNNIPIEDTYIRNKAKLASESPSVRFISYLESGGYNRAYYGIMRTSAFQKALSKYGQYKGIGADVLVMAYMSLQGKLKYIPEIEIFIVARGEMRKDVYKRYRKYKIDVPYINPGKQFYQYIMQIVNSHDELRKKEKLIKKILNDGKGYYDNNLIWLKKNYRQLL